MSRLLTFYLAIIFFSCASKIATGGKKPDWLVSRPSDKENWYGVGSVSVDKQIDYKKVARLRAVSEVAEQIKIKIESKLVDVVEVSNSQINEFSSSIVESRVDASLDFIEYFDSFVGGDGQFHVIAKLNRKKYFEKLDIELGKAEKISSDLILSASSVFNGSTFKKLSQAMSEIGPFLDLSPKMEYPIGSGSTELIYDIISKLIYEHNNRLQIKTEPDNIVITPLLDLKREMSLYAFDKKLNSGVSNISLIMSVPFLDSFDTLLTSDNGRARFVLPDFFPISSEYKILFYLDFSKVKDDRSKQLMKVSSLRFPLDLSIKSPSIFIDDDIFNLGKKISNRSLVDRVKTIFENSYSASFIGEPETSDLKMIINIQTERRRERLGGNFPFIVYGNGGINLVRTEDNSVIKVIQLHEKKGSDFNSENLAGLDAIDKIEKDLEEILGQLSH
tara:strand:- start:2944 stop:4281 length:1338 start_codon:yes stop_codon:yes gene_type:complete